MRRAAAPTRCRKAAPLAAVLALALAGASVGATCPPVGTNRASLQSLKASQWQLADDSRRQSLALELVDCLDAPDPELRDDLAFEALSRWMRAQQLAVPTLQSLRVVLLPRLEPGAGDSGGFRQPFAALALADVARADRVKPFLSATERAELVSAATAYVASVRDYRGFDARDGWRHGVAHGADLLLQLSVNPALDRDQLSAILAAIATQVVPAGEHFYVYGEGDRLMTPVFYIGGRDVFSADEWTAWFAALMARRPAPRPATSASLAATHNLNQFLLPLYVSLKESGTPEMQARMLPGVTAAVKALD